MQHKNGFQLFNSMEWFIDITMLYSQNEIKWRTKENYNKTVLYNAYISLIYFISLWYVCLYIESDMESFHVSFYFNIYGFNYNYPHWGHQNFLDSYNTQVHRQVQKIAIGLRSSSYDVRQGVSLFYSSYKKAFWAL